MIFCIGLSKTGTQSLAHALARLGYKVAHGSWDVNEHILSNVTESRSLLTGLGYNAYADLPAVIALFHQLDRQYPARFIYTDRDVDSWIDSRQRHLQSHPKTRTWYWFDNSPEEWITEKRNHEQRIRSHFSGKENLLWMNLFKGDGYDRLCSFLNADPIEEPFPHVR